MNKLIIPSHGRESRLCRVLCAPRRSKCTMRTARDHVQSQRPVQQTMSMDASRYLPVERQSGRTALQPRFGPSAKNSVDGWYVGVCWPGRQVIKRDDLQSTGRRPREAVKYGHCCNLRAIRYSILLQGFNP